MADYQGVGRTNYVRFRPEADDLLNLFDIEAYTRPGSDLTCLISATSPVPPDIYIPDLGDEELDFLDRSLRRLGIEIANLEDLESICLLDVIGPCLCEGEIVVWMDAGHEKARYVGGYACAIDHTGRILHEISLSDIYRHLPSGIPVTRAEY